MEANELVSDSFIEKLRYPTFENNKDLIRSLGDVLGIPASITDTVSNQEKCASAMSGVIMYRQLNRIEKMEVMRLIRSIESKKLVEKLIEKVTDVIVQPKWGLWSLSNEELQDLIDFHSEFGEWSNLLGVNPGAYGVAASGWGLIKKTRAGMTGAALRSNKVGLIVSVALMGISLISADQLKRSSIERERRRIYAK
ncbi:hypothetical protein ACPUEK_01005 [Marinomonas gallaica]|uniref:hypothetical protein n=1 Tax=Marinomonas gallaica TaxID=1806667 RepID=UPI003CE55A78